MWKKLGFSESPYNTNPLRVCQEDVGLLVGREKESIQLCTSLETSLQGILVLSGVPGVGKTSFLNVQQYLMESEEALCGPKLLAARTLCPTRPDDSAENLAQRSLRSLYRSVVDYCNEKGKSIPKQTKEIGKWLTSKGSSSYSLGLSFLGYGGNIGRQVQLPRVDDVTFEDLTEAIACIASENVNSLGFAGSIVVIDNVENLASEELGKILISFRDTLFSTKFVWWILIGQSGLGSLITALDTRVSERMTGSGIEIDPISLDELHDAVNLRVERFHSKGDGRAPLSREIHETLFKASFGETRYVFDYANNICTHFIEDMRTSVVEELRKEFGSKLTRPQVESRLDTTLGNLIAKNVIPNDLAMSLLKKIVEKELKGLALENRELQVLKKIGDISEAKVADYKLFSISSKYDFGNYLEELWTQNLLIREQQGRTYRYELRGLAKSAFDFDLLI